VPGVGPAPEGGVGIVQRAEGIVTVAIGGDVQLVPPRGYNTQVQPIGRKSDYTLFFAVQLHG